MIVLARSPFRDSRDIDGINPGKKRPVRHHRRTIRRPRRHGTVPDAAFSILSRSVDTEVSAKGVDLGSQQRWVYPRVRPSDNLDTKNGHERLVALARRNSSCAPTCPPEKKNVLRWLSLHGR